MARDPETGLTPPARYAYLGIGWFFVGLAVVGVFLPVLPTTPFLIISLWAFSKSSKRMHHWLYTHPTFGPYLVAWNTYRVIPAGAKVLSVGFMSAGWLFVVLYVAQSWLLPAGLAAIHIAVAAYILSKPSLPPS